MQDYRPEEGNINRSEQQNRGEHKILSFSSRSDSDNKIVFYIVFAKCLIINYKGNFRLPPEAKDFYLLGKSFYLLTKCEVNITLHLPYQK